MDDGASAIVPDISDDPSTEEVDAWENTEPKQYKWRVIDNDAGVLDQEIEIENGTMAIRDLGGKRLFFKTAMRPRARYLYFLFVVAQLKLAWRHEYRKDPSKVSKKQLGRGFWATKGPYLKRAFFSHWQMRWGMIPSSLTIFRWSQETTMSLMRQDLLELRNSCKIGREGMRKSMTRVRTRKTTRNRTRRIIRREPSFCWRYFHCALYF